MPVSVDNYIHRQPEVYEDMDDKLLSPRRAATQLGVCVHTLQRWDREGRIKCYRTAANQRRIPQSEINRILGRVQEAEETEPIKPEPVFSAEDLASFEPELSDNSFFKSSPQQNGGTKI